jgi:membrane-associated phospholipid phosphatase
MVLSKLRAVGRALPLLFLALIATNALAQSRPAPERRGLGSDLKAYVTAPARWDGRHWLEFGATLAAIGVAHQYDDDVRDHFVDDGTQNNNREDMRDALPGALALGGTWLYATIIDDDDGREEAATMAEAAVLGTVTAYVLKQAAGRGRPDDTADSSDWHSGGGSFPSGHVTAAFAIGTVLAESGNDRYRWLRRTLGYGLAIGTAYARLDHNAHWLSDTIAGAGIGLGTAHFVMNRRDNTERQGAMQIVPTAGGVMLSYARALR